MERLGLFEGLADALGGDFRGDECAVKLRQSQDRSVKLPEQQVKREQLADREPIETDEGAADEEDQRGADADENMGAAALPGAGRQQRVTRDAMPVKTSPEGFQLGFFLSKGADDA